MAMPSTVWCDVIQENDEFVDVIVPAFAQCRVRKDDVSEWQELVDAELLSTLNNHRIKSLHLVIRQNLSEWLVQEHGHPSAEALLELVGQPMELFKVQCPMESSVALLDKVWSSFPNLKVLQVVPTRLPSAQFLIYAYEAGRCQVPSLSLLYYSCEDGSNCLNVVQALAGPETRTKMASVLRELSFSESTAFYVNTLSLSESNDIAEALRFNQRLRYIGLCILALGEDATEFETIFKPLHGEFLAGLSRPLPIRCKCALLSVVQHAHDANREESIHAAGQIARLDSGILSNILVFSAKPVARSVALKRAD